MRIFGRTQARLLMLSMTPLVSLNDTICNQLLWNNAPKMSMVVY